MTHYPSADFTFERGAATVRAEIRHQRHRYSSCCSANHGEPTTQYDRWRYHPFSTGHAVRGRSGTPSLVTNNSTERVNERAKCLWKQFSIEPYGGGKEGQWWADGLPVLASPVSGSSVDHQSISPREAVDLTSNKQSSGIPPQPNSANATTGSDGYGEGEVLNLSRPPLSVPELPQDIRTEPKKTDEVRHPDVNVTEDLREQLLGEVATLEDIRNVGTISNPESEFRNHPSSASSTTSSSSSFISNSVLEDIRTAMLISNKAVMEEMEKNSLAIRCLEKAIKEHGERLTTLTNTVKDHTNYTRTYNSEERRRAEKRDEQRRQEREEDRKRWEAREKENTHSDSGKRKREGKDGPALQTVVAQCYPNNKKSKKWKWNS